MFSSNMVDDFKKGDYIYYYKRVPSTDPIITGDTFDTYPGIVIKVGKKKVKIDCDGIDGQIWVSGCALDFQNE